MSWKVTTIECSYSLNVSDLEIFPAILYSWEERVKMWKFGGEEGIVSN